MCDFEYEVAAGDLPDPLCMVAYVLDENCQHIRTIRLWRGEFGHAPPFDIGPDTLFVAYSAWAEMTCFKVLGWKFPEHIFDQHTAWKALAAPGSLARYVVDAADTSTCSISSPVALAIASIMPAVTSTGRRPASAA